MRGIKKERKVPKQNWGESSNHEGKKLGVST